MASVEKLLREAIRDKKLRLAADDILHDLQSKSAVEIVYADPKKRAQMPGIAAKVDGRVISVNELAEECIRREGDSVLDGMIDRRLMEQACRTRHIEIANRDIDEEIARAAIAMGAPQRVATPTSPPGSSVSRSRELPRTPTSRYGLADRGAQEAGRREHRSHRRRYHSGLRSQLWTACPLPCDRDGQLAPAQEVWQMARENPDADHFGQLAAKYSMEASSRGLNGEITPIQALGGEPVVEKEAFSLKPGELSSVIQVGDNFIILFCEGQTEPVKVTVGEVRELIVADVREKKLRIAMAREFDALRAKAQIDNYLVGKSQPPERVKASVSLDPNVRPASAREPARANSAVRPRAANPNTPR